MTSQTQHAPRRRLVPWPVASILLFAPTLICTILARNGFPEIYRASLRNKEEFLNGEWWQLLSPLLVQPDPWYWVLCLFPYGFAVYCLAEKQLGAWPLWTLAIGGTIPAEIFGHWWAPGRGGCSVAIMAVVSGLAVLWYLDGRRRWVLWVQIVISAWELLNRDLHGWACVAGFVIALVMWWRGLRPGRSGLVFTKGRLRRVSAESPIQQAA